MGQKCILCIHTIPGSTELSLTWGFHAGNCHGQETGSKKHSQHVEVARFRRTVVTVVTKCQGLTVGILFHEQRVLDLLRKRQRSATGKLRRNPRIFTIAGFRPSRCKYVFP